jgi:KEOPS complex subunit Pcc1
VSRHAADLVFTYDDDRAAALVADAVSVEVGEIDGDRTTARVTRDGHEVHVDVEADDLVALRAGLNTWGTLLEVAERAIAAGTRDE